MDVDTLVIGAGPMGASAARHLAADTAAGRVMVIGPDEPTTHAGAGPFGAWHDEARITRVIADDDVWATLAQESIDRYPAIEAAAGRPFHQRQGVLYVHETGEGFERQVAVARRHRATFTVTSPDRYPTLRMGAGSRVIDERGGAGTVNPRALVAGQLRAAEADGATVLRDHVVALQETATGITARTATGSEVTAGRIVLAAGSYLHAFGLVAEPLPLMAVGITALFFRVDDATAAELHDMPAILWHHDAAGEWLYMLPPIRYPDGRLWFKIGGHHHVGPLETAADIDAWHRSDGSADEAAFLARWVAEHIPVLAGAEAHHVGCVINETPSGYPIIRRLSPRIVVAAGDNGASAKSCDEIGRLAAVLSARDEWDSPLDPAQFTGHPA